nr:hypothetical protein [candidate division Zixibacteria bacterium]
MKSIVASIKRTRALLLTISLISVWIIACELSGLIKWQFLRTPFSHHVVQAGLNQMNLIKLNKDADSIRYDYFDSSDQRMGAYIKYQVDSEQIVLPVNPSYENIIYWCQKYYPLILKQWKDSTFYDSVSGHQVKYTDLANIVLERGQISNTKLPEDVIRIPQTTVPVIGLSVSQDDIEIVGSTILLVAMIWLTLNLKQIKQNTSSLLINYPGYSAKRRFFEDWIPMQFIFIRSRRSVSPMAFLMFFVPFAAILFNLFEDITSMIWYGKAYCMITGTKSWAPAMFFFDQKVWSNDVVGLLFLRWGILIIALFFLQLLARHSGLSMMEISRELFHNNGNPGIESRERSFQYWLMIAISVIISLIMGMWCLSRYCSIERSIELYGWTYAPNTLWSLIFLVVVSCIIYIAIKLIWKKLEGLYSFESNKNQGRQY